MNRLRVLTFFLALIAATSSSTGAALAFTGLKPLAILMPGAGGPVSSDFVMRNRNLLRQVGFDTKVMTVPRAAANAANNHSNRRKVFLIGVDRGANHVAAALALGAQVDAAVMLSGDYREAMQTLISPAILPETLVIHHRGDRCSQTPPAQASAFAAWSRGKAQVFWMSMPGMPDRNPCGPFGAHGFYFNDAEPVSAVIRFLKTQ
jgi:predicted esterase